MQNPKRVYFDVCVLCRPFDDQSQIRIRLETEAIQLILSHVKQHAITCMNSPVHQLEISAISNFSEREYLLALLEEYATDCFANNAKVRDRADTLIEFGLGVADAAHLAYAEAVEASFITTDDRLIKQCKRVNAKVWCGSPVSYCEKENL